MAKKTINVTLAVTYQYDENGLHARAFEGMRDCNAGTDKSVQYADYVQDCVAERIVEDVRAHMHTVENGVTILDVWNVETFEVEQ